MSRFSPYSNIPEFPVGVASFPLIRCWIRCPWECESNVTYKSKFYHFKFRFCCIHFACMFILTPFYAKKSAVDVSFFWFVCPKKCYVSIEIGGCILHMPCMSTLCLWTNTGRSVCMCGQSASFNIPFENHRSKRTKPMDLSVMWLRVQTF